MTAFASPWAFALVPLVGAAAWRALRRAPARAAAKLPMAGTLLARPTLRQRASWLAPVLFCAALLCLVVALARPQERFAATRQSKDAIAVEMAVDVSGSMAALDFASRAAPGRTRLAVVKETFRKFVENRPDDLLGLVAFGGYATTLCPLTLDHDALLAVLDGVAIPGERGEPVADDEAQTAIGDGLAMACARLAAATNVESKVAVLLSDGENNYGIVSPEEAAALAKRRGVKVYAIGVGSTGVVPALWRGQVQRTTTRLDERTLRAIASATGGAYYNVRDKDALERALAEIDKLERTEIEADVHVRREEKAAPWLAAGLALCAAAVALSGFSRRALL